MIVLCRLTKVKRRSCPELFQSLRCLLSSSSKQNHHHQHSHHDPRQKDYDYDDHDLHATNKKNSKHRDEQEAASLSEIDRQRLLVYQENNRRALVATGLGAAVNGGLAASKGIVGVAIGSTALIADGLNSLGDLFSDAVVYYTVTEARKGATPDSPWGTGKKEPIGAFFVASILALTGAGISYTAVDSMVDFAALWQSTSITTALDALKYHDLPPMEVKPITNTQYGALGVSAVSIGLKELLFRYTLFAGKMANSDAVTANAWQHRADVFVSGAVFAGLVGSYLGYPILDPLAGLLVSGVILKQAWNIGRKSLRDLGDAPATKEETQSLISTCLSVQGIKSVVDLKARQSGPFLYVECTVGVPGELSASAAHRLAELVRVELMRRHKNRVANAVVDVEPLGSTGLGDKASHSMRSHDEITYQVKRALLQPWSSNHHDVNAVHVITERVMNQPMDVVAANTLAVTSQTLKKKNVASKEKQEELSDDEDDDYNFNNIRHITSVSEVIVYYKDDGRIALKVDVCMNPDLTIRKAHKIAVLARNQLMREIEGLASVDVDLELEEESEEHIKLKTKTQT